MRYPGAVDGDLLGALLRLLQLLVSPQDIGVLAPLIRREVYYRLLNGEQGGILRQRVLPASRSMQISRAVAAIRENFGEALTMPDLARAAGMSGPSFHRHFRAVTTMSPLQFQKQIRLQEARRILLADGGDAASVGFEVGYESASQFSREYRRLFGVPPGRDAREVRARIEGVEAVV